MGNKAKLFKSSMNGFNKDDVNKYIIDMNNEFAAKEEEYQNEIKKLYAKLDEAEAKLASLADAEKSLQIAEDSLREYKEKLEEMEYNYSDLNKQYTSLKTQYAVLEPELILSKEKLACLEEANNVMSARCRELEAELCDCRAKDSPPEESAAEESTIDETTVTNDISDTHGEIESVPEITDISVIEKAKLYDKITSQVGEIIINANKSADEIIRNAEETAAKISDDSSKMADESHEKLKGITDATVAAVKKDLFSGVEACIREFKNYSDDVSGVSKNMISELEKKYSVLSAKIEYLGNTIEKRMSGKIRDFNGKCNAIHNEIKKSSEK